LAFQSSLSLPEAVKRMPSVESEAGTARRSAEARGKPPASTTSKRYVRELPVAPLDW